jgi:hypothetical protein
MNGHIKDIRHLPGDSNWQQATFRGTAVDQLHDDFQTLVYSNVNERGPMETLNFAIVGGGYISEYHIRAIQAIRGTHIRTIASRDPGKVPDRWLKNTGYPALAGLRIWPEIITFRRL